MFGKAGDCFLVKLEVVCSWCWLLCRCLEVSAKEHSDETRAILRRLSEIFLKRTGLSLSEFSLKKGWLETGISCIGSAAVIGWIPRQLLCLVVKTKTPRLAACC